MSWKNILIESNTKFKIKNSQLIIESLENKDERQFSINDISSIIIDNRYSILTIPSIIEISKNNVPLIINNEKHEPSVLVLPLKGSINVLKNLNNQLKLTNRQKGKIWQAIIKQQIQNQIFVLYDLNSDASIKNKFDLLKENVLQNDTSNVEAQAASLFFKEVFGVDFVRRTGHPYEGAYNFGVKILVSKIESALISYGLLPSIGIKHKGTSNYFNLAYDLIEIFRPLIIYIVSQNFDQIDQYLNLEIRKKLVDVLNYKVNYENRRMSIKHCIDKIVRNFVSFIDDKMETFPLPDIVPSLIETATEEEYDY